MRFDTVLQTGAYFTTKAHTKNRTFFFSFCALGKPDFKKTEIY